jgi:DNA ligase-4
VDLAVLAVGWDKDRARELRGKSFDLSQHGRRLYSAIVGPSVMTTLYTGVLTNKAQVAQRKQDPHFEILFRVSYGLTKQQLGELNNNLGRSPFQTRKFDPSGVRHQVR